MFLIEYRSALGIVSEQPLGGTPYTKRPGVRQVPMLKTKHVIFYRVDTASREVRILAIWHMARGARPRL
jgi:plasmid stabilization system protein ParE